MRAICEEKRSPDEERFLLAENRGEDKLTILEWNEQMASRQGIQVACSVNHGAQLVIHRMTAGSLDHPFARAALGAPGSRRNPGPGGRIDISDGPSLGGAGGRSREPGTRIGGEPQSLKVILDALLDRLQQDATNQPETVEAREARDEQEECSISSEPDL